MKIVSADETQWATYPGQRSLLISYKGLLQGDPNAPDNYEMSYNLFKTEGGSFSPRHHHNFDQFRWAFEQPLNYAPKLDIPPGHLGYFPEGAYYGPQTIDKDAHMLIVQFGGASGCGYMSWDTLNRATEELKKKGQFQKGYYTYTDETGRKFNKDGYEAVWEYVNERPIEYPPARYREPVIINPEAFSWMPTSEKGVTTREFGVFNERGTAASQIKLAAGASYNYGASSSVVLLYVLAGRGTFSGKSFGPHSAAEVSPGGNLRIVASEETTILVMVMPSFKN